MRRPMADDDPLPLVFSWSSGKDSAFALDALRRDPTVDVRGLLTTVNGENGRVAMHGVRDELLRAQAAALGLPLHVVELPPGCSNDEYLARTGAALERLREDGVRALGFGDLYLPDVRKFREDQCTAAGLDFRFPLFGEDTAELARAMIAAGVRATLTCVDPKAIDASFCGRAFDASLLDDLPEGADPCGENGEFHTVVTDGPGFSSPIATEPGITVERGGFVFHDVVPTGR